MKPKIKICGIQSLKEIEIINKYKVDYIGFVFAKSKRRINKRLAKILKDKLNSDTQVVGVFVNEDIDVINDIANVVALDIIQLHGNESIEFIKKINRPVWKAIKVEKKASLNMVEEYLNVDGILLDGSKPGSGERFNWEIFDKLETNTNLIIAGGLNAGNIKEAIKIFNPDIVDISSGVEKNNGKDEIKIREFLRRVYNE